MRNGFWLSKEANDVSDDGDYELLVHRAPMHTAMLTAFVLHICINILSTAFISIDTYIQLREDEDVQKCFLRY